MLCNVDSRVVSAFLLHLRGFSHCLDSCISIVYLTALCVHLVLFLSVEVSIYSVRIIAKAKFNREISDLIRCLYAR